MRARRHNRALTLVELIVALAIASMLMVAAMTVVGGLARAERRDQARHEEDRLAGPLRALLTADLVHADEVTEMPGKYLLKTRAALTPATMEQKHFPVEVEYRVQTIAEGQWLVRTQRSAEGGAELTELVCCAVSRFAIEPFELDGADQAADPGQETAWTATVEFDSGRQPLRHTIQKF